ncbi:MAG: GYF domain-containing protein [Bdellovibrionales bacterium]
MSRKWFLLKNAEVLGPFEPEALNWELQIDSESLVWGPGLNDWISGVEWRERLLKVSLMLRSLEMETQPSWWYRDSHLTFGPYIYHQLIQELKKSNHAGDLEIRQDPQSDYKSVYEYPTLVEEIGITRRRHSRVPLQGVFKYESSEGWQQSPISTVSRGGFGLSEDKVMTIGQHYKGEILSPFLGSPIYCVAEALAKQKNQSWGLRFDYISDEGVSILISYIKKFST